MFILKCKFLNLDKRTGCALFTSALTWIKSNQDKFIANVVGTPVIFKEKHVGRVISANLKEKQFVAVFDNYTCNLDIEYVRINFFVKRGDAEEYKCEFYLLDSRYAGVLLPQPFFKSCLCDLVFLK